MSPPKKETIAERREAKAASKVSSEAQTPTTTIQSTSRSEAKAKFVITRHRALYSNTSELKEFITFTLGSSSKRQKLNECDDFQQIDTVSQDLVLSLHNMIANSGNAASSSKSSAQLVQASTQLKKTLRHLTTSQRLSKVNK